MSTSTGHSAKYRADIDGLRAIAVFSVIIFHSGFSILSGGYVGVDVFFVISGYLITGVVFDEISSKRFTFTRFYKRRLARLLPALCITLATTLLFGFFFYDDKAFDNLGKEVFFSSFGAANILFGQGINYFAQEEAIRPLLHLWSLGVEEQFYLIWPILLAILLPFGRRYLMLVTLFLFIISLAWSVMAIEVVPTKAYFFPQYRGFELLIGALIIVILRTPTVKQAKISSTTRTVLSMIGFVLIIVPMFTLDEGSKFPGINALWPCLGTGLLIMFAEETIVSKFLSARPLVFIGLISYPLYLYHLPVISYLHLFDIVSSKNLILLFSTAIALPLAWLTYTYIEIPIRNLAREENSVVTKLVMASLVATLALVALLGFGVAKNNGLSWRFRVLNPFAYEVAQKNAMTFHEQFSRGYRVFDSDYGSALFIGDSVLQQYVYPLSKTLNFEEKDIDTVTRGGCVLLKNAQFDDKFSDISCNDLNKKLYQSTKRYDYVILSQSWHAYNAEILNATPNMSSPSYTLEKWRRFLDDTIEHFIPLAEQIIIIGGHPRVDGTLRLKPTVFLTSELYSAELTALQVTNQSDLQDAHQFFEQWESNSKVTVIHPLDIWFKDNEPKLHDGTWAFFNSELHFSAASTEYVVEQFRELPRFP